MELLEDKTITTFTAFWLISLTSFCRCKDEVNPPKKGYKFTNQSLKDLGIKFTPAHEYLYEAVKSLQEKGFLHKTSGTKVSEIRSSPPQKSSPHILISKL
uniref:Uncharacterized protein n=1 Tax=Arundo donax TaxID=35708 RepID=A0A0A8ZQE1_ARUDO